MKNKLLIIILLLVSSNLFAKQELYRCVDYDIGGFHYMGDDYKLIHFNQGSFEIKIDIDNNEIRSEDLGMPSSFDTENLAPTVCHDNVNNLAYLTCSNRYGQIFMFNTLNNEFTWASIFGHVADHAGDSLVLRYGICEKIWLILPSSIYL